MEDSKEKKTKAPREIVMSQLSLTPTQKGLCLAQTPTEFVKTKPGRGGKAIRYVETGYMTSQMNKIFGPLNWDWKIIEHGESTRCTEKNTEGEVWVRGRLILKDHAGHEVTKEAFGGHPIHLNIPIGDALKAASSDAFKKACASGLGIALDIYWKQLGEEETVREVRPLKVSQQSHSPVNIEAVIKKIQTEDDPAKLIEWASGVENSKIYTSRVKEKLIHEIDARLSQL